jgi:hypothetical protein
MTMRANVRTYLIVMAVFLLATRLTLVKAGERTVVLFEDFDSYPDGAYLSGGGLVIMAFAGLGDTGEPNWSAGARLRIEELVTGGLL